MKIKHLALILFSTLGLASCVTTTFIDYKAVSVPEEGGTQFTQLTKEEDFAVGPAVNEEYTTIRWYAAPLIAISPDGNELAFLGFKNNTTNVYLKNTRGGTSLIQRTFRNKIFDVSYSQDGKFLLFTENVDGNLNIYQINSKEGSAVQQITTSTSDEVGGIYGYDNKIYFSKAENATNSDGTATKRYYVWGFDVSSSLFTQFTEGFTPAPLPDKKSVVITRNNKTSGNGEIWLIDLEKGTEMQILANPKIAYSSPQVSPDGKKIVCVGISPKTDNKPANLDIFTVNIDGTGLTQLTFHPGHDVSPKWSPDAKSIYFLSQRANEKRAYCVWNMNVR